MIRPMSMAAIQAGKKFVSKDGIEIRNERTLMDIYANVCFCLNKSFV
jgi:hypothetical protein